MDKTAGLWLHTSIRNETHAGTNSKTLWTDYALSTVPFVATFTAVLTLQRLETGLLSYERCVPPLHSHRFTPAVSLCNPRSPLPPPRRYRLHPPPSLSLFLLLLDKFRGTRWTRTLTDIKKKARLTYIEVISCLMNRGQKVYQ